MTYFQTNSCCMDGMMQVRSTDPLALCLALRPDGSCHRSHDLIEQKKNEDPEPLF